MVDLPMCALVSAVEAWGTLLPRVSTRLQQEKGAMIRLKLLKKLAVNFAALVAAKATMPKTI